jgi:hypothetical protein
MSDLLILNDQSKEDRKMKRKSKDKNKEAAIIKVAIPDVASYEANLTGKEVCEIMRWSPSFLRRARELYGLKYVAYSLRTFRYKLSWVKEWELEREKTG